MMEYNNLLRDLNNYLSDLLMDDIGYKKTRKIILGANMRPNFISAFTDTNVIVWFEILEYARKRDKVIDLLQSALKEPDLADDEFIKGAIKNLQEDRDSFEVPGIKDKDWHGAPDGEMIKEKIIGKKSTIMPIGFLRKGTEVARAVVRIIIGPKLGTGFVLKNNWLVTNNHVLASIEEAKRALIEFNYEFSGDVPTDQVQELKAERTAPLDPGNAPEDNRFFTSSTQDWTIVKIAGDLATFGFLEISEKEVAVDDFVNIIQHPAGGPKQIAIYNNQVKYVDGKQEGYIVQYLTDTMPGSSGSPVFNSEWKVVALHHSGGWVKDPAIAKPVYRNQGTNARSLAAFIKENGLLN